MKKVSVQEFYPLFLKNKQKFYTDTRSPIKGAFFFAIKGENFDGNSYVSSALENGAIGVISDNATIAQKNNCFFVEDTKTFILELAHYHRTQISTQVIGITGSNGKTTTKDLIYFLLSEEFSTQKTVGNKNNHLGVSFTLLQCFPETKYLILEMGTNSPNDIKELCEISEPNFGIITNIGAAHLEGLGSVEGVFQSKKELYDFVLKNDGKIFINANEPFFKEYLKIPDACIYGEAPSAHIYGKITDSTSSSLSVAICSKEFTKTSLTVPIFGEYNLLNILCAVSVASNFGIPIKKVKKKLLHFKANTLRSNVILSERNNKLTIDCYNANPESMEKSVEAFFKHRNSAKKGVLILGEMGEIGENSEKEHIAIVEKVKRIADKNVLLYAVGTSFKTTYWNDVMKYQCFKDVTILSEKIKKTPISESEIFIKGSRSNKLEILIPFL